MSTTHQTPPARPNARSPIGPVKVSYIINSMSTGGAEMGLLMLLDNGFFADVQLDVILLHIGDETLFKRLQQHPGVATVRVVDRSAHLKPATMLKGLLYLTRHLTKEKPDVLIASLAQSNILALLAARVHPRLKMITFFHNSAFSKAIYEKIINRLSPRIDACFYDNVETFKAVKSRLPERPDREWYDVPLFVAQGAVRKTRYGLSSPIGIVSVGRLNAQKNYFEAILAIKQLKAEGYPVHLHIAGEGELREPLGEFIREHQLESCVTLLGFTSEWSSLTEQMDIYLLSSTREGLSIATLEAMSYGLPVVATAVGGICEYGRDGENMIIAPQPTSQSLAQSLRRLLDSDSFRESIGQAGRDTAIELYGKAAVIQQLDTVKAAAFEARKPAGVMAQRQA